MARAAIEVCSRSRDNEVMILWVPAHAGIAGNEEAYRLAKEAARGRTHEVVDEYRWGTSLSPLPRRDREQTPFNCAVGRIPYQARAPAPPSWGNQPPKKATASSPQVAGRPLIPVADGARRHRFILA